MAFVTIEKNKITGVFSCPQPDLAGYKMIDDTDARLPIFLASQEASFAKTEPTLADLKTQLDTIAAQVAARG